MKRKTKSGRILTRYEEALMKAADNRVKQGLMRARDVSLPKMQELHMTTPGWGMSIVQLKEWPEKQRKKKK